MRATGTQPAFEQVDDSKSLSQLIRSNAPSYWSYMKKEADLERLQNYLCFEGTIAGDPHLGNFGPLPLRTVQGGRIMKFVNIDFDDCGRGPFVLDYVRYVIAIKAQSQETKERNLLGAYISGLEGKKVSAPAKVQEFLDMNVADYDEMSSRYVAKKSTDAGFKYKEGEVEPYDGNVSPGALKRFFHPEKVVALAKRFEDRGGSADELRIWVLVQGDGPKRRIIELKEYGEPGTARYRQQAPVKQWLAEIRDAFWPGLVGTEYDLIALQGKLFWIRDKRVSLINVPYSNQTKHDREFVVDLALYDANILGMAHGNQAQSEEYLRAVQKDPDEFHNATKSIGGTYLKLAQEALDRRKSSSHAVR